MIYWVQTIAFRNTPGGESRGKAMDWLKKFVKFNNETWPGHDAELMTNFDGSMNVVHVKQKYESISECERLKAEWWQNEDAKALMDELAETAKSFGQSMFADDFQHHYYNIVEME